MKWAFIDYENVSNLAKIDLAVYEKIIVFLGARQPKLDFGDKKYDKLLNVVVVQIKAVQANNLDFHLTYYLGKFDALAEPNIVFDIVSNDKGYVPLIAHVKANGRVCNQLKIEPSAQVAPKQVSNKQANSQTAEAKLLSSLTLRPKDKRPQKVTSLKNHIAAHLGLQGNQLAVQNKVNYLVNAKIIVIKNNADIEYLA